MRKPSCLISIIPGTNIIRTDPYGAWTPEYTIRHRNEVTDLATKKFKGERWGFLPLICNMDPILDARTSDEFAKFHPELEKYGCAAAAFVVGKKVAIKAQSQRHHDTSSASQLQIRHFHEEEEALKWLKSLGL